MGGVVGDPYISNIVFNNSRDFSGPLPSSFTGHLPIPLLLAAGVALFIGLHTAALTVSLLALGHVVMAVTALVVRHIGLRHSSVAMQTIAAWHKRHP